MEKHFPFNVLDVELSGCNLIEASAGTGKTYSIGILVLRLLLEKALQIDQVLMVTFTEAAVEELRLRIRQFVREANAMATDRSLLDDGHIAAVVKKALSADADLCKKKLKDAQAVIDDLAILTIHGFCNRTLGEFAFETQQLFEKEVVSDPDDLLEYSVNEYWRRTIAVLPKTELSVLLENGFKRAVLKEVVRQLMDAKLFSDPVFKGGDWLGEYRTLHVRREQLLPQFCSYYISNQNQINEAVSNIPRKYGHKYFSPYYGQPEMLWQLYLAKLLDSKCPAFIFKMPQEWMGFGEQYLELERQVKDLLLRVKNRYYRDACDFVINHIEKRKDEKAVLTFNDLIDKLHFVLNQDRGMSGAKLAEGLREKYRAVFIDEFQDTDKVQIEIFNKAFREDNEEGTLFFIGDPKQSIYAFRKADLETYKKSREGSRLYTMTTNYRSTEEYVQAMNDFFRCDPNFFSDEGIQYIEVQASPAASKMGAIRRLGEIQKPIDIMRADSPADQNESVCRICLDLLHNHTVGSKPVKPSDIGVLVFSKQKGNEIKQQLNSAGIPAVLIDDTKVIETAEALSLQYILEALHRPSRNTINRAMLSDVFACTITEVAAFDAMQEMARFQEASKLYHKGGVYAAVMRLLDLYNVKGVLLAKDRNRAQRVLSNLYQLAELCQNKALENQYDLEKLIAWLIREQANKRDSNAGYELRLESDEDAVKIVTIHKSKGLAYDIVIAPSMQLQNQPHPQSLSVTYQDDESLEYVFSLDVQNEHVREVYSLQKEKENRRLMYVTLTRAKYKTFVVTQIKDKHSYMSQLGTVLKEAGSEFIGFDAVLAQEIESYEPETVIYDQGPEQLVHITEFKNSWHLLSYSSISKKTEKYLPLEQNGENSEYDDFVFNHLPKGAGSGNFLHYMFEHVDFQDEKTFPFWFDRALLLFGKRVVKEDMKQEYLAMLHEVLNADFISDIQSFRLADVPYSKRMNELQFYFDADVFDRDGLAAFDRPVEMDFGTYSGYFQGFIDLVVEHQGVYYIIDWKSNYLGNSIDSYSSEKLDEAMDANNYHLQYFIYTIALVRFLKKRQPSFCYKTDFGGAFYVFLRGCRKGECKGVYHHRPNWEAVEQYL